MKNIIMITGIAGLVFGGAATAYADDSAEKKADRIEQKAEVAKDRIDETAEAKKERVDRNAEAAKERLDRATSVDERAEANVEKADRKVDRKVDRRKTAQGRKVDRRDRNDNDLGEAWVTTKVKAALFGDDELRGSHIKVDSNADGVITLTGTVPSLAAKEYAVKEVKAVEGVRRVVDNTKVDVLPPVSVK